MIKSTAVEASIDRVTAELRHLAYSGSKGSITAHFDGKRFVRIEVSRATTIEDPAIPTKDPAPGT